MISPRMTTTTTSTILRKTQFFAIKSTIQFMVIVMKNALKKIDCLKYKWFMRDMQLWNWLILLTPIKWAEISNGYSPAKSMYFHFYSALFSQSLLRFNSFNGWESRTSHIIPRSSKALWKLMMKQINWHWTSRSLLQVVNPKTTWLISIVYRAQVRQIFLLILKK